MLPNLSVPVSVLITLIAICPQQAVSAANPDSPSSLDASAAPLDIPFNSSATIGPDGPWNFITLNIGSGKGSNVSFFPQVLGSTSILTSAALCRQNSSLCPSGAEYYDEQGAPVVTTLSGSKSAWQQFDAASSLGQSNYTNVQGNVSFNQVAFNAPLNSENASALFAQNSSLSAQNMNGQPVLQAYAPISLLQLDTSSNVAWDAQLNTSMAAAAAGKSQNLSLTWPLRENSGGARPQSYNLHLGSAMFGQPGSLQFGGYDSKRIIEPMNRYNHLDLSLTNLGFGTASGPSPWPNPEFFNFTIFVGHVNAVLLAPEFPYLALTYSLCDVMRENLPITFDPKSNLYLWNQQDPQYRKIMASSSYLEFTFPTNQSTFSIKVPFASLNLTLEAPITSKTAAYFPCFPSNGSALVLGRAFLQSANLGFATDGGLETYTFLGQAPGPSINKSTTPDLVTFDTTEMSYSMPSNAPTWEETWTDTWNELSRNLSTSSTNSTSPTSSGAGQSSSSEKRGLTSGQIAGIVVGVITAVIATAAGLWFAIRHKRRQSAERAEAASQAAAAKVLRVGSEAGSELPVKWVNVSEIDTVHRVEADGRHAMYEMSPTCLPCELPADLPTENSMGRR